MHFLQELWQGRFDMLGGGGAPPAAEDTPRAALAEQFFIDDLRTDDPRLRRFATQVAERLNSLIRQEVLVKTRASDKKWEIVLPEADAITADDIADLFSPTANQFYAGPVPSFRALREDDLPRPSGLISGGASLIGASIDDWGRVRTWTNAAALAITITGNWIVTGDWLVSETWTFLSTGPAFVVLSGTAGHVPFANADGTFNSTDSFLYVSGILTNSAGSFDALYSAGFRLMDGVTVLGQFFYSGAVVFDRAATTQFIIRENGSVQFSIASGGAVSSVGNITITNAAPTLTLTDSTGSAKSLTQKADANKVQWRESADADDSGMVWDLANKRLGIRCVPDHFLCVGSAFGAITGSASIVVGDASSANIFLANGANDWGRWVHDAGGTHLNTYESSVSYVTATLSLGRLALKCGTGGVIAKVGGTIVDHYADVATTSTDGAENNLYNDTIPAGSLGANGDKLDAYIAGTVIFHATATRRWRVYFGGTTIFDSGTFTTPTSNAYFEINVKIIREASDTVRCSVTFVLVGTATGIGATETRVTGLTLANANNLQFTGVSTGAGAASGDITANLGSVQWGAAA